MINETGINLTQFLNLEENIRISSSSNFNAKDAYENAFEDVILETASKTEEEKENKINFSSLGAPAGFFLDTSLLNEEDKLEISSQCCSY
ncbi:MAG: hypothetical protein IKU37_06400 [Candidatus Gastranaerophilales bacterium]|nr:hypothetical protein [Candidatus Gastranaerophilales bacterium]